jgi:hypothetical protein
MQQAVVPAESASGPIYGHLVSKHSVAQNRAPTPAVVLTMYDDDVTVPAALGRGAYGYTLKEPDRTTSSPPYG